MRSRTPTLARVAILIASLLLGMAVFSCAPVLGAEPSLPPDAIKRVAQELAARRFSPTDGTRSARDVFAKSAPAVALIIGKGLTTGSSVVLQTDGLAALLVTNDHIAAQAFERTDGPPFVVVVFYEPTLARDVLDELRAAECLLGRDRTPWCQTLRQVTRSGDIVARDADRDLALIRVRGIPPRVLAVPQGLLADVSPGDEVAVIGHPLGYLWSLTTGIVSGVRINFLISEAPSTPIRGTVIQTQTPINPGNSGGPVLLVSSGRLVGVVFAAGLVPAGDGSRSQSPVTVPAQGLNLAIGINEVADFVAKAPRSGTTRP